MAKLVFHVQADYEEVIKLRNEIERLKKELKNMDAMQSPAAFNTLNTQLSASTKRMNELVTEAAKAGAVMEGDLKRKIFDASQTVNGLTEKIIAQKAVIKDVEADVKRLGEAYRNAKKNNPWGADAHLTEYNAARKVLDEEKAALFALTQEQANARLSVKKLRDEYALYRDDSKEAVDVTDKMVVSLKKAFAAIGGVALGKKLISDMIRVRGEFQAADTAIQTLLGSKEKADALMSKVREYAKISPLEFSDVTQATQMMLGFNIEAEKVPRFLQAIGDVSMGDTQKFNSLTLAFSQMSAAGKLMGQDLNQMINAGFNPLQIMADKTGKSIAALKEEMSKGAISAEMVQQAFIDATSAGGKFYKMSENASKIINGQLSMMQDAIDSAFNEIGQKSEGFIMSGIQMTTTLIENYETVGKVLAGLVVTYGTYRAALIANIALTQNWAVAARTDAVAKGIQTAATKAATIAQASFNAVANANPYVLLATAIGGLIAVMVTMKDEQDKINDKLEEYENKKQQAIEKEEKHRTEIEKLISIAQDESLSTENRRVALVKLEQQYPSIFAKYDTQYEKLTHIRDINREIAELEGRKSIKKPQNELSSANKRINELLQKGQAQYSTGNVNGLAINTQISGRTKEEERELKVLLQKQRELKKEISKNETDDYLANLTGLSNKDLQREIDNRRNLLARMDLDNKKYGKITRGGAKGVFSREEIEGQINVLTSEQNGRRVKKSTPLSIKSALLKDLNDAQKALADFDKSSSKYTIAEAEEKRKKLKDAVDNAEKKYKEFGGDSIKSKKRDVSNNQKAEDERQKAEKKNNEELVKLQQANKQALLDLEEETTEKKLKLIDLSYDKQKAEIEKREKELVEQNKKAGTKGLNEKGLTEEQQTEIDKANKINDKSREKQIADIYKEELTAMRNYLKEYGSFEQQRLAITEEYEEKIAKAVMQGDKLLLQKERDKKLSRLEYESIASNIDWKALFSGVGSLSSEMLQPMIDKLMSYTKTTEYLNADSETQKNVADLIQELRQYIGTDSNMTWKALGKATEDFVTAVGVYNKAVENEKSAIQRLNLAKKDLNTGKITKEYFNKIQEDVNKLGEATQDAKDNMENFGTVLNNTSEQVNNYTSKLTATLNNAKGWNGVDGFGGIQQSVGQIDAFKGTLDSALSSMGDGIGKTISEGLSSVVGSGLSSIGSGLSSVLTSGLGTAIGFVAQIPRLILNLVSSIKQFVTGVLDSIKELISLRWIDDLVVSILDAVGNLIDAIFDLPENLYHVLEGIVVKGVGGLLDGVLGRIGNILSFGALSSDGPSAWFTNSNAEKVAETIERLKNSNEILTVALDDLSDEIKAGKGTKSVVASNQAIEYQRKINENYLQMAQAQAGYHDAHHSWGYYWNKSGGYNDEQIQRLSQRIGRQWNGDIWDLSPEEMKKLRSEIDMWNQIKNTGEGPYGEEVQIKLNDYIEQAGKIEDITNELYTSLTSISFDSMYDSFIDNLMDMEYDAEKAAENISGYFMRAMLSNKIGEKYSDKLENWWKKFGKAMEDNTLSEIERTSLTDEYMQYVNEAIELRNQLAAITGYDKTETESTSSSEASGSINAAKGITDDTANELVGRVTAVQLTEERLAAGQQQQFTAITQISGNVSAMVNQVSGIYNIADETRTILANSYMELQQINENTREIVKPIKLIQSDIAEVKRNISNL